MGRPKKQELVPVEIEKRSPKEAVLLEDACEIIMKNACISIDLLREGAFCTKCYGKRDN